MPPVAILAGGLATRLYPVTQSIPKSLVQVAGKPFIEHQLNLLRAKGVARVVLCAGHLGDQIKFAIGDGKRFGISVDYSFDGEMSLGTGGAVKKALPMLGDLFFVMYGDSYLDIDFSSVHGYFMAGDRNGVMTVFRNRDRWGKSNVVFEEGVVSCYDKTAGTSGLEYIDYGLSLLRGSCFESFKDGTCFDLGDVYRRLILCRQMSGIEVMERFYEIGSVSGLEETGKYLRRKLS
ncbi:MAG: NTP transferase domain-containing protein [Candidatus Omnitrophica bacterium]|nr:NTP transferase domain-containing protein [Candidatus Omnitrophota bacterium]